MNQEVPINNLKIHNQQLSEEFKTVIERVMASGWYILGPEVEAFESEFASFCNVRHAVGVANGTDALELALRALDVGREDKVITVANAGGYSSTAIQAIGAEPHYVDVNLHSMTMDPIALEEALTPKIKAVIVTHLYGRMADLHQLLKVCEKVGVPLIEDCAQAHGARLNGKPAGSWGTLGCFSFYPTKNLGCLGDAGIIVTKDTALEKKIRQLRQYGWSTKFHSDLVGGRNSRMDELQAGILRVKLPYLKKWNERRVDIAKTYSKLLINSDVIVPSKFKEDYVAHLYVIKIKNRDEIKPALSSKGISTDIHYPVPDYKQTYVSDHNMMTLNLPITERCCNEVLTLPCFPDLTDHQLKKVTTTLINVI